MLLESIYAIIGLDGQEMIIIFLDLLLLFGAKKNLELDRGLSKGIKEFKDAIQDVHGTIEEGINNSIRSYQVYSKLVHQGSG